MEVTACELRFRLWSKIWCLWWRDSGGSVCCGDGAMAVRKKCEHHCVDPSNCSPLLTKCRQGGAENAANERSNNKWAEMFSGNAAKTCMTFSMCLWFISAECSRRDSFCNISGVLSFEVGLVTSQLVSGSSSVTFSHFCVIMCNQTTHNDCLVSGYWRYSRHFCLILYVWNWLGLLFSGASLLLISSKC